MDEFHAWCCRTQSLLLLRHTLVLAKSQTVGWDWSKICWFTCSEPNDKSLILTPAVETEVSIDLRARSQGHHGNTRRLPTSQQHFDAHVNHSQIHTVHTQAPAPQVAGACAKSSLPFPKPRQRSHSATAGDRARGRTVIPALRRLLTTPSTCETSLLQTITTSANTRKPHSHPVGHTQINKMSLVLSFLHYSLECQNSNYNHKIEWHTIMERRGCIFFKTLEKKQKTGSHCDDARRSKGAMFMGTKFNPHWTSFWFTQHLWGWWRSVAGVRLSNSDLYTSVEYH